MEIEIRPTIEGRILDIGGGGEGIIGRVYQDQVIAIDNRQSELDEAPDCCEKRLMDATDLKFSDESFDHVTAFYSLMFIPKQQHDMVIQEATRVLIPGGSLSIWDAAFEEAEPYIINLQIKLATETIETTYGVFERNASQSPSYLIELCRTHGLELMVEQTMGDQFYLCFEKR